MILYPAIDLLDGTVVRLRQGDYSEVTAFSNDPLKTALNFDALDARYLHVVDLDAARSSGKTNRKIIKELCQKTALKIQIGGGIRSMEDVEELIAAGADRLVLGTAAILDPEFLKAALAKYKEKIVVGIDARDGTVRVEGWTVDAGKNLFDFANEMKDLGVSSIVYTDIARDGEMQGPNLEMCKRLKDELNIKVILSGGVRHIEDLKRAKASGLDGAIIGKAIYQGDLDLALALKEIGQ